MICSVCNGKMEHFFQKDYGKDCGIHTFLKCQSCGIVINKTVYDMSASEWKKINDYHKSFFGEDKNDTDDYQARLERLHPQAELIESFFKLGIVEKGVKAVDYGCGDGLLSKLVDEIDADRQSIGANKRLISNYEKYIQEESTEYISESELREKNFKVVISTCVLEHLVSFDEVNYFFDLVSSDGLVFFHTLVCENVPCDPDWFYIWEPIHCTLFTNESMRRIYDKHSFAGCSYHLPAKMWCFYKEKETWIKAKEASSEIPGSSFFSEQFVDYWKQEPYHN